MCLAIYNIELIPLRGKDTSCHCAQTGSRPNLHSKLERLIYDGFKGNTEHGLIKHCPEIFVGGKGMRKEICHVVGVPATE